MGHLNRVRLGLVLGLGLQTNLPTGRDRVLKATCLQIVS